MGFFFLRGFKRFPKRDAKKGTTLHTGREPNCKEGKLYIFLRRLFKTLGGFKQLMVGERIKGRCVKGFLKGKGFTFDYFGNDSEGIIIWGGSFGIQKFLRGERNLRAHIIFLGGAKGFFKVF